MIVLQSATVTNTKLLGALHTPGHTHALAASTSTRFQHHWVTNLSRCRNRITPVSVIYILTESSQYKLE